jgi:hypothetical protein
MWRKLLLFKQIETAGVDYLGNSCMTTNVARGELAYLLGIKDDVQKILTAPFLPLKSAG